MKTIELAGSYDFLYFCEQDYRIKRDALEHAWVAFREIDELRFTSIRDLSGMVLAVSSDA